EDSSSTSSPTRSRTPRTAALSTPRCPTRAAEYRSSSKTTVSVYRSNNAKRCFSASLLAPGTAQDPVWVCTSCGASRKAMAARRHSKRVIREAAVLPSTCGLPSRQPRMADRVSVLVVEDHALTRAGLIAALAADASFDVVGEAADGAAGYARALELAPDVAVIDIGLPGEDGIALTRRIRRELPATHV